METKQKVKCKIKKIEYFVAVTPDGQQLAIKGIDKYKLCEGMELEGEIKSNDTQDKYADGSYARSVTVETYLWVDKQKKINEKK